MKYFNLPFTKKDYVTMEIKVLTYLNFSLSVPTPINFLNRFLTETLASRRMENFCLFFTEAALYSDIVMYTFKPSEIAIAAFMLSLRAESLFKDAQLPPKEKLYANDDEELNFFPKTLFEKVAKTQYEKERILACGRKIVRVLYSFLQRQCFLCQKYKTDKYSNVAKLFLEIFQKTSQQQNKLLF